MKQLCRLLSLLLLLMFSLSSCRTTSVVTDEPVVLERVQHDTVTVKSSTRDSVYVRDSIFIHQRGDTVFAERWNTKYIERIIYRDSLNVRIDSIPVQIKTTEKVYVKYTTWYTKLLSAVGMIAIFGIIILIIGNRKWW